MKHWSLIVLFVLACSPVALAQTQVLRFDDLPRNVRVGEGYAPLGVHFSLTDWAVMGGLGEGDPGNWGLRGTNGSAFMGLNGNPSYSMTITFDSLVSGVSFDASRSNGSNAGNGLDVQYWIGTSQVGSASIAFGNINVWSTVAYAGAVDRVTFQGRGSGSPAAFGVDNMAFVVPPPSSIAAFLLTGAAFAQRRRRRVA